MQPRPLRQEAVYRRLVVAAFALAAAILAAAAWASPALAQDYDPGRRLNSLKMPDGFRISVFAEVPRAREIVVLDEGRVLIVSTRGPRIFRVHDGDRDGQAERVETLLDGLKVAHGIALHPSTGALYIVEQHRITRLDDPLASDVDEADLEPVFDGLPDKSWHGWRPAAFGPDGMLYMGVGAPCNICRVDGLEGTITRIAPDGDNVEIYAAGVRNSVGFDWHPSTGELWFTDNGGDNMGDHRPPDELNHAPEPGRHFGFPYVWGTAEEPYPRQGRAPRETTPAAIDFQAHAAALGIEFYEGAMFPEPYRNDAFVAMHGSWNRSPSDPAGYRIMRVRFDPAGRATAKEVFIDGFLTPDKDYWGRPVHFAELPDGSLLLSDDASGAVYRITYAGQ